MYTLRILRVHYVRYIYPYDTYVVLSSYAFGNNGPKERKKMREKKMQKRAIVAKLQAGNRDRKKREKTTKERKEKKKKYPDFFITRELKAMPERNRVTD